MPKLRKKTIYTFILVVVALYVVIAVIPAVTGKLTRTEAVTYGELKVSDDVTCYIVRDETVYLAKSAGTMSFKVKEGELVKRGAEVMNFKTKSASKDTTSKSASVSEYNAILKKLGKKGVVTGTVSKRKGMISFHIDGYEASFTPDTMAKLTYNDVNSVDAEPESLKRAETEKGDPIFKIYDNANWYINAWIDEADISKYEKGNYVTVEIGDAEIKGSIENIVSDGDKWHVIIRTNRYWKDLAVRRSAEGKIVTTDRSGLLIDNGSITTKGRKVGVYVKDKTGQFDFTQVNVLASNSKKSLVSSGTFTDAKGNTVTTVKVYDEILRNP